MTTSIPGRHLRLDPGVGPTGAIGLVAALGDDAFHAHPADGGDQIAGREGGLLDIAQGVGDVLAAVLQHRPQARLAVVSEKGRRSV